MRANQASELYAPKKKTIPWEEVLKRKDLVGGEYITTESNGQVIRGPLSEIKKQNNNISVALKWAATCPLDDDGDPTDKWENWDIKKTSLDCSEHPEDMGNGVLKIRSILDAMHWNIIYIYPKGQNNLDPKVVKNLKI